MIQLHWTHIVFITLASILVTLLVVYRDTVKKTLFEEDKRNEWVGDPVTCQEANGGEQGLCIHYGLDRVAKRVVVAVTANLMDDLPTMLQFLISYRRSKVAYVTYWGEYEWFSTVRKPYDQNASGEFTTMQFSSIGKSTSNQGGNDVHLLTIIFDLLDDRITASELHGSFKVEPQPHHGSRELMDRQSMVRTPLDGKDPRVVVNAPIPCQGAWSGCTENADVNVYHVLRSSYNGGAPCYDLPPLHDEVRKEGDTTECV